MSSVSDPSIERQMVTLLINKFLYWIGAFSKRESDLEGRRYILVPANPECALVDIRFPPCSTSQLQGSSSSVRNLGLYVNKVNKCLGAGKNNFFQFRFSESDLRQNAPMACRVPYCCYMRENLSETVIGEREIATIIGFTPT